MSAVPWPRDCGSPRACARPCGPRSRAWRRSPRWHSLPFSTRRSCAARDCRAAPEAGWSLRQPGRQTPASAAEVIDPQRSAAFLRAGECRFIQHRSAIALLPPLELDVIDRLPGRDDNEEPPEIVAVVQARETAGLDTPGKAGKGAEREVLFIVQ